MKQVSLYEAKTHLSKLVDEAEAGEEIVIAKNGKPKARLAPIAEVPAKKEPRKLGRLAVPGAEVDFDKWWRDWKESDKYVQQLFDESLSKPVFPKARKQRRKRKA